MNEQRAHELFLDYHRGSLPPDVATALRSQLASDPALQREFDEFAQTLAALDAMPDPKPSPRLRAGVLAAIEAEKRAARKTISVPPRPVAPPQRRRWFFWLGQAVAAIALLAAGFLAGTRHDAPNATAPVTAAAPVESSTERQIADLRQQVDSMQRVMTDSLLKAQQQPSNDRLRAVLASARLENPSDRVIDELIGSLALDPSTNVRLTALDSLYPHARLDAVRAGVLALLPREPSPLVQVAMINFLVAARDRDAMTALEKISRSDTADRSVRDAATRALNQL